METMDLFMISASTSHLNSNHLSVVVYFMFFERSHRSLFLDSISSLFSHSPHALSYFLSRVSGVSSWKWLLFFCTEVVDMKTSTLKESSARWREGKLTHSAYSGICSLWSFLWKGGRSQQKKMKEGCWDPCRSRWWWSFRLLLCRRGQKLTQE